MIMQKLKIWELKTSSFIECEYDKTTKQNETDIFLLINQQNIQILTKEEPCISKKFKGLTS